MFPLEQVSPPEQSLPTRPKTSHWSKSPHLTKDAPLEKVSLPEQYLPTGASLLTRAKSHHWNKTPHHSNVFLLEQVSPPEKSRPTRPKTSHWSKPGASLSTREKSPHQTNYFDWSKSPHLSKDASLEKVSLPEQYFPTGASLLIRAKSH